MKAQWKKFGGLEPPAERNQTSFTVKTRLRGKMYGLGDEYILKIIPSRRLILPTRIFGSGDGKRTPIWVANHGLNDNTRGTTRFGGFHYLLSRI